MSGTSIIAQFSMPLSAGMKNIHEVLHEKYTGTWPDVMADVNQ